MTLVIMAAGLASRYGGAKQIERVGPGGAILMEYTIHDAMRRIRPVCDCPEAGYAGGFPASMRRAAGREGRRGLRVSEL